MTKVLLATTAAAPADVRAAFVPRGTVRTVTAVATALEAALSHGVQYIENCQRVIGALKTSPGVFPDRPLAQRLLEGELTVEALARGDPSTVADTQPRARCRRMFVASLLGVPGIARSRAAELAEAIEKSCFKAAIEQGKRGDSPCLRVWGSEEFRCLYSGRCATVNAHIDPQGSVCRTYGTGLVRGLIAGSVTPEELGRMTASQMCPEASRQEREIIESRRSQKMVKKWSDLFKCPYPDCGIRKCEYTEVRTRSSDEPADIKCICLGCNRPFRGG